MVHEAPPEPEFDEDNPEWTVQDFARAKGPEHLPPAVLAAFPRTRGPQKEPTKTLISLRIDPDVLQAFKATGAGWQGRMNEVLKGAAAKLARG